MMLGTDMTRDAAMDVVGSGSIDGIRRCVLQSVSQPLTPSTTCCGTMSAAQEHPAHGKRADMFWTHPARRECAGETTFCIRHFFQ